MQVGGRERLVVVGNGMVGHRFLELYGERAAAAGEPPRELPGCFVYRTIEDLEAISAWAGAHAGGAGAVIGGGLLGLEAAYALKKLGMTVHVIELAPRLMALQLDDAAGAVLRRRIEDLGVV